MTSSQELLAGLRRHGYAWREEDVLARMLEWASLMVWVDEALAPVSWSSEEESDAAVEDPGVLTSTDVHTWTFSPRSLRKGS